MGMDVYAIDPKDPDNNYFRANVWCWRAIHEFMGSTCAKLYGEDLDVKMSFNDGAGIPAEYCEQVADKMEDRLRTLDQYDDDVHIEGEDQVLVLRNVKYEDKPDMSYGVSLEYLHVWVDFVRNSNGFEVF